MTSADGRRALTELFGGQGWPARGDDLLRRSLEPRGPELLLEAPGWLGLAAGQLVLEAGCRDATHAIALAGRYGCRGVGVDLVRTWLPRGRAEAAAAGLGERIRLVQGDLEALPVARIDQILGRGLTVTELWSRPRTGSDHLPIAARIRY